MSSFHFPMLDRLDSSQFEAQDEVELRELLELALRVLHVLVQEEHR